MSDESSSDELNPLAPRKSSEVESWETVLERAERIRESDHDGYVQRPQRASKAGMILKASLPFLVIAFYFLLKYGTIPGAGYRFPSTLPPPPESLSGISEEKPAFPKLTDRQKNLITRLETMRRENRWADLIATANAEVNGSLADHPVIQALVLIARTRSGERNLELENELISMEANLRPAEKEYADLMHGLRIARVQHMLSRIASPDLLIHNIETFQQLLGDRPRTTEDVIVRIRLAQRFEDAGNVLMEEGSGYLTDDIVLIRQARSFYQMGLRWVVQSDRWYDLVPISQAASPEVETLLQKMRAANRKIHGPSLPLTDNDSETWSGKRGDPVHDMPGSRR